MKLSKRLSYIRSFYKESSNIWDVGCDHGQLGLSFMDNTEVENIFLVDPSSAVTNKLSKSVKDSYITIPKKITVLNIKGQKIRLNQESNTIFIAGMGGNEIKSILESIESSLKAEDDLIISPHRKVLELRQWLGNSSLNLKTENVIFDEGQFYPIICLKKDPALEKVSAFGRELWESSDGRAYRQHQLESFSKHQDELSQSYIAYLNKLSL